MNKYKIKIVESKQILNEASFSTAGIGMKVIETDENVQFIIYHVGKDFLNTERATVAGSIGMNRTDKPCMPDTFEVNSIYTAPHVRSSGLGSFLYAVAFYYTGINGDGLTSDHRAGTKLIASNKWKNIAKDPDYVERATDRGNTKFDYDGSTPDPNDDCDNGSGFDDDGVVATDHSYNRKSFKKTEPLYLALRKKHKKYEGMLKNNIGFNDDLEAQAGQGFNDAYDKADE